MASLFPVYSCLWSEISWKTNDTSSIFDVVQNNHINYTVVSRVLQVFQHCNFTIFMEKWKSTICSEFFKDQEFFFENFKIFGKITASDWLKIDLLQFKKMLSAYSRKVSCPNARFFFLFGKLFLKLSTLEICKNAIFHEINWFFAQKA